MHGPLERRDVFHAACQLAVAITSLSSCSRQTKENRAGSEIRITEDKKHDLDFLFRLVADGDADQSRGAIEALYEHRITNREPWLLDYSMPVEGGGMVGKIKSNPEHGAVLLRAIPRLIESMPESQQDNPAWWVLISIQPACPAPKKAIWEKWWQDIGRRHFEAMANAR